MVSRTFIKLILYLIFALLVFVCSVYFFYKRRVIASDFKSIVSKSSIINYIYDLRSLNVERWSVILILIVGIFFRLWQLATWVPVYIDEATWGLWSEIIQRSFALDDFRWLLLTTRMAGKPPLVAILFALSFNIFGVNLFAIRVVSAFASVLSILFVYKLGRTLFGTKVGLISALMHSIIPYDVFFSRLAFQDSVVSSLITGSILCYTYGFKRNNDLSTLLGGVLFGFAIDAKPLGLKIAIILFFYLLLSKNIRDNLKKTSIWMSFILTTIIYYPFLYYSAVRRFGPSTHYLTWGGSSETQTSEISSSMFSRLLNMPTILYDQFSWMLSMFTISAFILVFIGIGTLFLRKKKIELLPLIWISTELLTEWIPYTHRAAYILSIVPPACLVAGVGITLILDKFDEILIDTRIHMKIPSSVISLSLIALCFSYTAFFSCAMIFNPRETLPEGFRMVIDGRFSGIGWEETLEYLQQENYPADTVIFPMPKQGFEFIAKSRNVYPRIFGVGYIRDYFNGAEFSKYLIEDNTCLFLIRRYNPVHYQDFDALVEIFPEITLVKIIEVYGIPEVYIFIKP